MLNGFVSCVQHVVHRVFPKCNLDARAVYREGFILFLLFIEKDLFILCLLFIEKDVYLVFATCAFPQRACVRASLDTSTNN